MSRSRGRRGRSGPVIEGTVQGGSRPPLTIVRDSQAFSIGDLSGPDERGPLLATFGYFGQQIRVNPDLTEVDMIDFLDEADHIRKDDPRSMLLVKEAARSHVHPDDFEQFWKLRKQHRQGVEQLMGTIWQIVGGVTGKANGQPSGSSAGQPATNPNSAATSSAQDDDPLRAAYLRQIERFEAMGNGYGVSMAAQVATAAEARGINLSRDDALSSANTG